MHNMPTPREMIELAHKDVLRLAQSISRPMPPPPKIIAEGVGPRISFSAGYDSFKASYCCAEATIRQIVTPILKDSPAYVLELEFFEKHDPELNEDYGHHRWFVIDPTPKA